MKPPSELTNAELTEAPAILEVVKKSMIKINLRQLDPTSLLYEDENCRLWGRDTKGKKVYIEEELRKRLWLIKHCSPQQLDHLLLEAARKGKG